MSKFVEWIEVMSLTYTDNTFYQFRLFEYVDKGKSTVVFFYHKSTKSRELLCSKVTQNNNLPRGILNMLQQKDTTAWLFSTYTTKRRWQFYTDFLRTDTKGRSLISRPKIDNLPRWNTYSLSVNIKSVRSPILRVWTLAINLLFLLSRLWLCILKLFFNTKT